MSAAVVAGVNAPPIFQLAEHVLDLVALAVERPVMGYLDFPVSFKWDAGFIISICKGFSEPVGVVALVRQERLRRRQRRQQGRRSGVIADLARRQKQGAGPALAVANRVQF